MDEFLGGLFALLLLGAIVVVGGLLVTSHAVLYWEAPSVDKRYFVCRYFTGTRSVEMHHASVTGCPRFIPIGQ